MTGRPKHHKLDVYGTKLHLALDDHQWRTLRRRFDFLPENPGAHAMTTFTTFVPDDGSPHIPHVIIYVDAAHHDNVDLVDTCAHEACHAALRIAHHIGHKVTAGDEPVSYLTGWITRWIWEYAGIAWTEARMPSKNPDAKS